MFDMPEYMIGFTTSLIMAQESGKNSYSKIVKEAFSLRDENKGSIAPFRKSRDRIIEITYNDILSVYKGSYPEIDKTKGDFTKYRYYNQFVATVDTLRKFYDYKYPENLAVLIALHEMIINERPLFEHGYRYDLDIFKAVYTALVLTAMELEAICISDYLNSISTSPVVRKHDKRVVVYTRQLVNLYRDGQWAHAMAEFKKKSMNFTGEFIFGTIVWTGASVLVIAGIFAIIRELIYQFYKTSYNLNDNLKAASTFLKEAMKEEKAGSTAKKREETLNKTLVSLSDIIETRIIREDKEAEKAIAESNKTNYSRAKIEEQPKMMADNQVSSEAPSSPKGAITFM